MLFRSYQTLFDAQNKKAKGAIKQAKLDIRNIKVTRTEIARAIKVAANKNSLFRRTTKPYQDAVKLLTQKENYQHFDDIAAMFDEAKARKEENDRIKKEKADQAKADRLAEIERLKHKREMAKKKRANRKNGKNNEKK